MISYIAGLIDQGLDKHINYATLGMTSLKVAMSIKASAVGAPSDAEKSAVIKLLGKMDYFYPTDAKQYKLKSPLSFTLLDLYVDLATICWTKSGSIKFEHFYKILLAVSVHLDKCERNYLIMPKIFKLLHATTVSQDDHDHVSPFKYNLSSSISFLVRSMPKH